jgi:hypothetical protein
MDFKKISKRLLLDVLFWLDTKTLRYTKILTMLWKKTCLSSPVVNYHWLSEYYWYQGQRIFDWTVLCRFFLVHFFIVIYYHHCVVTGKYNNSLSGILYDSYIPSVKNKLSFGIDNLSAFSSHPYVLPRLDNRYLGKPKN